MLWPLGVPVSCLTVFGPQQLTRFPFSEISTEFLYKKVSCSQVEHVDAVQGDESVSEGSVANGSEEEEDGDTAEPETLNKAEAKALADTAQRKS